MHPATAALGLALLGWQTKRSFAPWLLLLALAGGWLALRAVVRLRASWWARAGLLLALAGLPLALLSGALAAGRDPAVAREWYESTSATLAPRALAAPVTGAPALALRAGQNAIQGVPLVAMEWAQNQDLELRARVWAPGGARGRLAIDYGWATAELPFEANGKPQELRVRTFLPLYGPALAVGLYADAGAFYADGLALASARDPAVALLENGDIAQPGYRDGALQERLIPALRLRELAWGWRSGWLLGLPPLGWALARIFFASFWGQFGWMSLPMVAGTPWEPALALVCAGGLAGALLALLHRGEPAWRRRALALLLAGLALGLALPLLNAYTQPRSQAIQQGRYLFAMLAPLALLLAWGWRAWLPARWRAAGLALWAAWWLTFAGAALFSLARVYRPDLVG